MDASRTYKSSVGVKIQLTLGVNLTGTTVTFNFKKPDLATKFSKPAVIDDAVNGVASFTTTSVSDLDQVGAYELQAKIVDGTKTLYSTPVKLKVEEILL